MARLKTEQILALLAPIVIIQLGLMIAALHDLSGRSAACAAAASSSGRWSIVFVNIVGPIVYFIAGREDA